MSAADRQRVPEERAKAAERARRWRERQKQGRRPLLVEVPDRFASTLVERDMLVECDAEDAEKLAAKATEIIEHWIDQA
jgi:hypothetical protein